MRQQRVLLPLDEATIVAAQARVLALAHRVEGIAEVAHDVPRKDGASGRPRAGDSNGFCAACSTGRYPVPVTDEGRTRQLVLFDADER